MESETKGEICRARTSVVLLLTSRKAEIENSLIAQPDVAAGLINAICVNGVQFVKSDELHDALLNSMYESKGRMRNGPRRREILRAKPFNFCSIGQDSLSLLRR